MPADKYKTCRVCRRTAGEVGQLSYNALCVHCRESRFTENVDSLKAHSGPWFNHWRRAMAASVGAVLVDDDTTGT